MAGRADEGLLITTGTFAADAEKEATRDGAPPIDLIDGGQLCELLKRYDLGVHTVTRTVEEALDRLHCGTGLRDELLQNSVRTRLAVDSVEGLAEVAVVGVRRR
jgi:hypothetical protein